MKLRTLASAAALTIALGGLAACNSETQDDTTTPPVAANDPAAAGTSDGPAAANPTVGGAEMLPTRNIVENASNSRDHTTLVSAVTAAGLGETLSGAGPFTVFAPTNAAFDKLPDGAVEALTQPAQKQQLTGILTYHVVPGALTAADLAQQIQAGGGTATLTTVQGAKLTARAVNGDVQLTDAAGGTAMVTQADVRQSNGVIHVIDGVLQPTAS